MLATKWNKAAMVVPSCQRIALVAAATVLGSVAAFAGRPVRLPAGPDQLLLPFSSSLAAVGTDTEGPARLKHLLEDLDAVRSADVQVSNKAGHLEVLVLVRWRSEADARPATIDFLVSLALRTIPGLAPADLTVADASGAVLYDGARPGRPVRVRGAAAISSTMQAAAVIAGLLILSLLLHGGLYLAVHRNHTSAGSKVLPPQFTGRSRRELGAALDAASPGVRGSVLMSLPPDFRRQLAHELGEHVDWPERGPEPAILTAVLNALLDATGGGT